MGGGVRGCSGSHATPRRAPWGHATPRRVARHAADRVASPPKGLKKLQVAEKHSTEEKRNILMEVMDTTNDGFIDYQEFLFWCTKDYEAALAELRQRMANMARGCSLEILQEP